MQAQAVEAVLIAALRDDVRRPLWPPLAAPNFSLATPGGMSSSSWATSMASTRMRKKFASAATAWPLRFMWVVGMSRRTSRPLMAEFATGPNTFVRGRADALAVDRALSERPLRYAGSGRIRGLDYPGRRSVEWQSRQGPLQDYSAW